MTNLENNSGSRVFAAQKGLAVVNEAIKRMRDDNLSQDSVDNQQKMATLKASIPHFKDFGKPQKVPSPMKALRLNYQKDKYLFQNVGILA